MTKACNLACPTTHPVVSRSDAVKIRELRTFADEYGGHLLCIIAVHLPLRRSGP